MTRVREMHISKAMHKSSCLRNYVVCSHCSCLALATSADLFFSRGLRISIFLLHKNVLKHRKWFKVSIGKILQ